MDLKNLKNAVGLHKVSNWYGRHERPLSSLSLIGGFVFDALTLRRVDAVWENFWILGHLVIVAVFIVFVHSVRIEPGDEANPSKTHFWLVNILQFFFGGLLSVFLVFYFRSAELSTNWPFLLLLAVAFWANESLKRRFVRMNFQLSLFFLSLFCCFIYLTPLMLHRIGTWVFIFSGFLSLFAMFIFLNILVRFSRKNFYKDRRMIFLSVGVIFVVINILYFTNLIPPIPLSLKDFGVYHSITKTGVDSYTAKYENFGWKSFFEIYPNFHISLGDTAYAYSAVFSPTDLNITIIHQWQYYDETTKKWTDYDKVSLSVLGGREGGFRTYSVKSGLFPGYWRVNVTTSRGEVIGRLRFYVTNGLPVSPTTKVLE